METTGQHVALDSVLGAHLQTAAAKHSAIKSFYPPGILDAKEKNQCATKKM
jgi:hypothetical protein